MGSAEHLDPSSSVNMATSAIVTLGNVLSRRAFLRAAGAAGLGLVGACLGGALVHAADAARSPTGGDPIGDLADALEYDAERIFRFVADEIRYEPYAGVLRGARGTLASRAGNSADQALLLAALLRASMLPVRFAMGAIDGAAAEGILRGAVADALTIAEDSSDALAGAVPGRPSGTPSLSAEEQARLDAAEADLDEVRTWANDQILGTAQRIEALLREAGVAPSSGFTPMPDLERARHVWIQMAVMTDWVDMDPTPPGATRGVALAAAEMTADALPDDLAHRVELSIIGEWLEEGSLNERVLLGLSETAEALAGVPLMVFNADPQGLSALGVAISDVLGSGTAYVPAIVLGDEAIVGPYPIVFGSSGAAAEGSPGPGRDALGDFLDPGTATPETTAEWVELKLRAPGTEPTVVRRALFDRISAGRRAAGSVGSADLEPLEMVQTPDGRSHPLPALDTHWLTVSTGLPSRADEVLAVDPEVDIRAGALASQLHHLLTAALGIELASPAGVRPFIDGPNVVACSMSMQAAADEVPLVETVMDIWHRSHGVAPVDGAEAATAPTLMAGVVPHVAERLMGQQTGDGGEADPAGDGFASVGAIFEAADAADVPWQVLAGAGATEGLPWDAAARARLEGRLASGWVAIVPARPVALRGRERLGWWLFDPASGRLIDELDDGRGANFTEWLARIKGILDGLPLWARIGLCIATLFRGMFAVLTLGIKAIEGKLISWGSLLAAGLGGSAPWTYRALGC